ncbi:MAG: hypothetical protein AVDCRST_MAG21-841 [uncultured Nocardioidaceae bacterium]|uniref:Methyltransferase domain-containing protein n=1 Tax=uncultured Nocardioidaceae bacterium TaxID=253824 RepID=A0A6J4N093_9ACTN|nr:MAG: hypothetical protein AVDCRST_MAG21-841 [uncultured Nocardioidaceae bacterium]
MTRWEDVAGSTSGEDYAARMRAFAASGAAVHGEADFVAGLVPPPARVLDAGCGTGRVGIELHRRCFDVVGVDVDESMLGVARRQEPGLPWMRRDLALLDPAEPELGGLFDVVLLAGNVIPLLAQGTEADAVRQLAQCLTEGGRLVAGFGLDVAHLPLDHVPVTLDDYDRWCADAGLALSDRFATWEREPYDGHPGYAVSVHVVRQPPDRTDARPIAS